MPDTNIWTADKLKALATSFIASFPSLTTEEVRMIADNLTVAFFEKGTMLIAEGEVCDRCYFVLKGCLRQYTVADETEKTTQFYTEEQAAVFFTSYATGVQSQSNLVCIEDSVLIIGEAGTEAEMYKRFPKLEEIVRMMLEHALGKMQDAFADFITSSPEERYLDILNNRPDLLQRVPQHQLASYIGITPESLSRIRKRMQQAR